MTSSVKTCGTSGDFTILIISFKSSFEMNTNTGHALASLFLFTFFWHLITAFEVIFLANPGKLSLVNGILTFASTFLPKLSNPEP